MPSHLTSTLSAALVLLASTLSSSTLADEAREPKAPLSAVADLRYGVSLYHYYQNENLEALSELLVAQKRGGIQGHGDNPEIMEGGMSMAYGLEGKATQIFERLLAANRSTQTRDAAWYYLAQMRYDRGDWPATEQLLGKVSARPEPELQPYLNLLRFNLDIRQARLDRAAQRLEETRRESENWPYMQFNLGSAYARQQRYAPGIEAFQALLRMPQRSDEHLALFDKAMTAAGYAHLLQEQYPEAVKQFKQVRLESPFANRALLGYGWAALEQEDYRLALKPWQALARRSLIDENTQEVLIAIPYAYEKMGFQTAALEAFQNAEVTYLDEIGKLEQVINNVQGYAIREALNIARSDDFDWLNYADKSQLSPQLSYLVPLFSQRRFNRAVQELRDLLAIQVQFQNWQDKLVFYRQMLDEREQNRALEMDYIAQEKLAENIKDMTAKRDQLATQLARIDQQQDIAALVSTEQEAKMQRILNAERNLKLLQNSAKELGIEVMPAAELEQLALSVRRHKGALLWASAEFYEQRYWRIKSGLAELNVQLQAMQASRARIASIVRQGFDLAPIRARLDAAELDLLSQLVDVEQAIEAAQDALRKRVLTVLEGQRGRLLHYLAQSRLSISRLLDQTSAAGQSSFEQALDEPAEQAEAAPSEAAAETPAERGAQ